MNAKSLIFGLLWLITLAVAYTVGSSGPKGSRTTDSSASKPPRVSPRTAQGSSDRSAAQERSARTPATRLALELPPLEAVAALAQLSDPLERSRGFLALIDQLGPEEFQDVVAEFRSLGITQDRMGEYRLLLSAWAKLDPITALAYAKDHTGGSFARNTILATWAQSDLAGSIAWAESNHEGEGANPWMVGIISGIANTDPERASQLTESLPYSRERGEALAAVVGAMMKTDPVKARAWAESVGDERLRSGAIAYVADALSRKAPEEAARWLSSIDDPEAQQRAAEDVAERFAEQDIDKAMVWAESLSASALENAAEGVVDRLVEQDPIQAAEWLAKLGQTDANLDGAIGELIRGSATKDPFLAATWIGGLQNDSDRERYYHRVLGPWMTADAEAAKEFIQNNEVPDSVRNRFNRN